MNVRNLFIVTSVAGYAGLGHPWGSHGPATSSCQRQSGVTQRERGYGGPLENHRIRIGFGARSATDPVTIRVAEGAYEETAILPLSEAYHAPA